ncbi:MAG: hypothetical protein L3J28_10410 [Candidatus Polarisedimenticolaceae bacterium]|nr:hypothetical protein [Candidatus Polarisedimenticolaceae bacterium]
MSGRENSEGQGAYADRHGERVDINEAYPLFSDYRAWLSGESGSLSEMAAHWYDYPASGAAGSLIWDGVTTPSAITLFE